MPDLDEGEKKYTLNEAHKAFAITLNGIVWRLLEKNDRSQLEDDELLYAAHACSYHWLQVGTGVHQQRGEYLISKVYISLNRPIPALHHAKRCLDLTEQHKDEMKDFDIAYAYEGLARAHAINGQIEQARDYYGLARKSGDAIKDDEDKSIFDGDFASGDWFGIT